MYSMENENDPEKKVSLYDKIFIAYNDTLRIVSGTPTAAKKKQFLLDQLPP